jgi:hypothetical protein
MAADEVVRLVDAGELTREEIAGQLNIGVASVYRAISAR